MAAPASHLRNVLIVLSLSLRSSHAARSRDASQVGDLKASTAPQKYSGLARSPQVMEIPNLGKECSQAECPGGPCSFCGTGFCCKKGSYRGGCDGFSGHEKHYVCTPAPPKATSLTNSGKECWNAADCRSGRCGYCGSGLCCRRGKADGECDGLVGGAKQHECVALGAGADAEVSEDQVLSGNDEGSEDKVRWDPDTYCKGFRADDYAAMLAKKHGLTPEAAQEKFLAFCNAEVPKAEAPEDAEAEAQSPGDQISSETKHPESMATDQELPQEQVLPETAASDESDALVPLEWKPDAFCNGFRASSKAAMLVQKNGLTAEAAQKRVMADCPEVFHAEVQSPTLDEVKWQPNVFCKGFQAGSQAAMLAQKQGLTQEEAQQQVMSKCPEAFRVQSHAGGPAGTHAALVFLVVASWMYF